MKKFKIFYLFLLLCLTACAGEGRYIKDIKQTPDKKLIVLSGKKSAPSFKPYIIKGERYYPLPDSDGFVQFGKASWYGKAFHGRLTASGEVYNMYKKSAAHKTLPLGTYVKAINLSNNKQTIVRINDRGPFVKGRIIDLSYAAAKEVGLIGHGVAKVKIMALGKEVGKLKSPQGIKRVLEIRDLNKGNFAVQVGAFKDQGNALRLVDRLKVIFNYVEVAVSNEKGKKYIYRVRVSRSRSLQMAVEIEKRLEGMGFKEAFIVGL